MKVTHISTYFIVFLLFHVSLVPLLGSTTIEKEKPSSLIQKTKTLILSQSFSPPAINEDEHYAHVSVKEANTWITQPDSPVLPAFSKTIEFPLGTRITNISCNFSMITEIPLSKNIVFAEKPVIWNEYIRQQYTTESIHGDQLVPETWYIVQQHAGINTKNNHVLSLTLTLYPVRYNPARNLLHCAATITVEITYEEPSRPLFTPLEKYDFLIITNPMFTPFLQPLVRHKEQHNISTKMVSLREIYSGKYFPVQGRDRPEKIKYFIKDASEQWGVTYVMLVGDFRKMPVRYSHLETDTGGTYEELEFLSDLYYADLYDAGGNFSSWDSDNDGVFGEWPYPENSSREDVVDLSPDIYIGRLACRNVFEVNAVVQKIIDYETHTFGSSWFHTMVVCGGDTFDKALENGTDYNEGEEANKRALSHMTDFTPVRIWASYQNLSTENITIAITDGAGFLYFVGHGNPRRWATHNNGDYMNWTEGYMNKNILSLSNKGKYPIVMVGGCHNSQFDVTLLNLLRNPKQARIFSTWIPECWGWVFVAKRDAGAIASIGSTGYGGVNIGDANNNTVPDCVEGADGWFETEFFRLYSQENITVLGEVYGQTVKGYVQQFPVTSNRYDAKIVETHVLFGDPTLRIGGYPS